LRNLADLGCVCVGGGRGWGGGVILFELHVVSHVRLNFPSLFPEMALCLFVFSGSNSRFIFRDTVAGLPQFSLVALYSQGK